jgi:hypothetical protein
LLLTIYQSQEARDITNTSFTESGRTRCNYGIGESDGR